MGRPKIVEFTGLEDTESQDSRPAKKKKGRQADVIASESEANSPERVNELTSESPQELATELIESAVPATESPEQLTVELAETAKTSADAQAVTPTPDQPEVIEKVQPKIGVAKVRSKRYQSLLEFVEKGKLYPVDEALETLKKTSKTKFDPTVEVQFNLGVDITKTDQQVRTTTKLPHSIGKAPKLLVFGDFKAEEGIAVGTEKTIEDIEKTGKVEAEKILASPDWMPRLTKVAKILGPKGLMPNPKTGTVTTDVAKTVADFKGGLLEIRTEVNGPIIHSRVGKLSLEETKLKDNLKALVEAVTKAKPSGVKRNYLKSAYLHVTMGPSLKLDLSSLNQ
jgi:large subunit ribosomal protein L1